MMQKRVSVEGIMNRIVPITRFNKGEASKIFEEIKTDGTKVVLKNNDPVCVLMTPDEYEAMLDQLMDYQMAAEAARRLETEDCATFSEASVMAEFGITETDLDEIEVDIE